MHAPASPSPVVVNGQPLALPQSTLASATLLHVLRNDLALNGPKYGCGLGQCGACTVLLDGVAARACVIPAQGVAGREVTTLEGLPGRCRSTTGLHPVQQAFVDEQAARRAGAEVRLIGAVGVDSFAAPALALLKDGGVDLSGFMDEAAYNDLIG